MSFVLHTKLLNTNTNSNDYSTYSQLRSPRWKIKLAGRFHSYGSVFTFISHRETADVSIALYLILAVTFWYYPGMPNHSLFFINPYLVSQDLILPEVCYQRVLHNNRASR